ncbi:MAG: thioredoxin family protein [Candidatus Peribacteraceae bacterium]
MNKSLVSVLVVVALGIVGYLAMQNGAPETVKDAMNEATDEMMKKDDAVMEDKDAMVKDDAMMESDAMKKVDSNASASVKMGEDAMMKKEDTMMEKSSAAYLAYSDGVVGNGKTSVLFFHAAWCPACRQGDKDLTSIYGAGTAGINTYKVDFDTAAALKQKYGVTSQHTFVLIDGTGKAIKTMQGATAAELTELVKG